MGSRGCGVGNPAAAHSGTMMLAPQVLEQVIGGVNSGASKREDFKIRRFFVAPIDPRKPFASA